MQRAIRSAPLGNLAPVVLHDILKLRADVFVVEQDCVYTDLDGRDTEVGATHFWVELDGKVVACLRRLQEPDGSIRIGRIATSPGSRGQGLAAALIDAAMVHTEAAVLLDAQAHLEEWYSRLGFTHDGAVFIEDGIPHVPMRREGLS